MRSGEVHAWAVTAVAAAAIAGPAAASEASRTFHIPSQPLASALEAFGRQSGREILFNRDQTSGKTSVAVQGVLSPDTALARLLAGAGLTTVRPNAGTYIVRAALPPPTAAENPAQQNSQIESLVVTATKRPERLADVPLAVSAITGQEIARRGIRGNEDLSRIIPSLSFTQLAPGELSLAIRGLTNSYGLFPTVSFYVDETPLDLRQDSKSGTPSIDMFDAARVEVLRGPQGALFGAGSLGGTVRVLLNPPDPKAFSGKAETGLSVVEGGSGAGYLGRLAVNIPLADTLALRVSGSERHSPGFTDVVRPANYYVVAPGDPVIAVNANTSDLGSVRAALGWTPDASWRISPSLYFQRADAHGYNQSDPNRAAYTYARGFVEDNVNSLLVSNLTVRKSLDFAELMSSSSYTYKNSDSSEDYSAWVARRYAGFTGQRIVSPYFPTRNHQTNRYYQYTQEIRLASQESGALSWIVGGYFSSVKQKERQAIDSPTYAVFYADRFRLPYSPVLLDYQAPTLDRQYAAFADFTYRPVARVEVSAGARYYELNERNQIFQSGLQSGAPVPLNYGRQTGVNPRFNIKYAAGADASLYVSASKGFRPGGPNTSFLGTPGTVCSLADIYNRVYQSDSVWNYEAGAKMQVLDRTVTFNAAAYQIDWSNIQGSLASTCGTFIANFGSARIRGAEAEVYWTAARGLTLTASGSFNDAQFVSLKPGVPAALSIAVGRRLVNTPKEKWALGGEYDFAGPRGAAAYVRAALQHAGSTPSSYTNVAPAYYWPAYTNADASAGLTFGRTEVQVHVENLFNRYEVISVANAQLQTYPVQTVAPPRSFGVSVKQAF